MTRKSLLSLFNKELRRPNQTIGEFKEDIKMDDATRKWYAQAFVDEGYADEVFGKDKDGNEVTLAKKA